MFSVVRDIVVGDIVVEILSSEILSSEILCRSSIAHYKRLATIKQLPPNDMAFRLSRLLISDCNIKLSILAVVPPLAA